jgi:hypothetical protein
MGSTLAKLISAKSAIEAKLKIFLKLTLGWNTISGCQSGCVKSASTLLTALQAIETMG